MRRVLLVAALLAGAAAAPALADPPENGPGGGRCHLYFQDPFFDHGLDGVPPVPGKPYVICDR